jgi:hypothetical protein
MRLAIPLLLITALAAAAQGEMQLTPQLLKDIRDNRYVDESVQTTNGNIVGIFTQLISDQRGKPVLGVIQAYDNVTRKKEFVAVPWPLFRFDPQNRRIQIQTAAQQLRQAPKFQQSEIAGLANGPPLQKIYEHFGTALGGGAVAATMGSQSGQGSSAVMPPATNEAQPTRGSVSMIYIFGALALVVLGLGYVVRRRT